MTLDNNIFYAQKAIDNTILIFYNISTERYVKTSLIGVFN